MILVINKFSLEYITTYKTATFITTLILVGIVQLFELVKYFDNPYMFGFTGLIYGFWLVVADMTRYPNIVYTAIPKWFNRFIHDHLSWDLLTLDTIIMFSESIVSLSLALHFDQLYYRYNIFRIVGLFSIIIIGRYFTDVVNGNMNSHVALMAIGSCLILTLLNLFIFTNSIEYLIVYTLSYLMTLINIFHFYYCYQDIEQVRPTKLKEILMVVNEYVIIAS